MPVFHQSLKVQKLHSGNLRRANSPEQAERKATVLVEGVGHGSALAKLAGPQEARQVIWLLPPLVFVQTTLGEAPVEVQKVETLSQAAPMDATVVVTLWYTVVYTTVVEAIK